MIRLLDGILTKENREAGFSIEEEGDHFVLLLRHGVVCGTFTQATTAQALNDAADELRWVPSDIDPNYENFRQQTDGL